MSRRVATVGTALCSRCRDCEAALMTPAAPSARLGGGAVETVTEVALPAETRFAQLLDRLLRAAESSLAAGDLEQARNTAEEVRAVDPENLRAAAVLQKAAARQLGTSGERMLMTLLFSDLVGSTMLSEHREPEQLRDLFTYYRSAARAAVTRYGGSVMQFAGEGVLAGFGHPEPHEDDARRAVLAGLDLVTAIRDAGNELERRFEVTADVRIGIHTGRVVVTDLRDDGGVAERESVVGLVPNLAARIRQVAEPGTVVISDVTRQLVDADFFLHSLGERRLKGITRPVELFAVDRPRYAAARFQAERYRKAGLVGRDGPRRRLLSGWEDVRRGAGPVAPFLVVGEAGIGKSRLTAEILDRVQASGGTVLGAVCLPYYTNVSLWPMARLLERVLTRAVEDTGRQRWLEGRFRSLGLDPARMLPYIAPLAGIQASAEYPAPDVDPSAVLDETLDRLVDWMVAAARQGPYLFALEDVHWADPSTLEFV